MSKPILPATPATHHLRAAVALILIIESGLADSRISIERAALLAAFCQWTFGKPPGPPEAVEPAESVGNGSKRIKIKRSSAT